MGEREGHPPAGALAPSPPSDEGKTLLGEERCHTECDREEGGGGTAQAVTEGETQENRRPPCPFVGRDAHIAPPQKSVGKEKKPPRPKRKHRKSTFTPKVSPPLPPLPMKAQNGC